MGNKIMFISHNTIPFFGKKIKVLNFSIRHCINKKASRRYKQNYKILKEGKLVKEFEKWLKKNDTFKLRFVILGDFTQEDMTKLIEFTNTYSNLNFYVYTTNPHYNLTYKMENFKVIYITYLGVKFYDNTVYSGGNEGIKFYCPKFSMKRPCDTCLKCISEEVVVPEKVIKFLIP